jgi:hypothetical protein
MGRGLGLRFQHHEAVLEKAPPVGFLEVFPENYLYTQGRTRYMLDKIAERYPISLHAITIAIGSTEPLDMDYLKILKKLAQETRAPFVSDHLCWIGIGGENLHSVLPVPYNEESLQNIVARVKIVQDFLERPLFIENSSGYMAYQASNIPEPEFLARMCVEGDCGLLLDVNNAYIGAYNHGFSAEELILAIPPERIGYIHVAGHMDCKTYLLDTHDRAVKDEVWELYRIAEVHTGGRSTLLEWDGRLPDLDTLCRELDKARQYQIGGVLHVG